MLWIHYVQDVPDFQADGMGFRIAIQELTKQSLVKMSQLEGLGVEGDEDASHLRQNISVHRLVQLSCLQSMNVERKRDAFTRAQKLLLANFLPALDPTETTLISHLSTYDLYIPHVLALESRYRELHEHLDMPEAIGPLLERCIRYVSSPDRPTASD